MGYRCVYIANAAKLSTKNNRMLIDTGDVTQIPIEDVRCIMVENKYTVISAALLSKLAEAGVVVFICNAAHLPTGVFHPINSHSRQLKQLSLQIEITQPQKKRLWQQIVLQKIENQALCLELSGFEGADKLRSMLPQVRSGDTANVESKAAAFYFRALFGKDFTRDQDNVKNALLNYGYSIFRGYIARSISVYGFEPSLGLHHKSTLNNFNLADDLLESFRPIVDLFVAKNRHINKISTSEKANLLDLLNIQVIVGNKRQSAAYAVELMTESLVACLKKQKDTLALPRLKGLERHEYE